MVYNKNQSFIFILNYKRSRARLLSLLLRRIDQITAHVIRNSKRRLRLAQQSSAEQHRPVLCAELGDATFDLRAEVAHQALDRPCGRIAQSTDRPAFDLFSACAERMDVLLSLSWMMIICYRLKTYVSSSSMSISRTCPRPSTKRSIMFIIHVVPSLQGVHWPHDSCL